MSVSNIIFVKGVSISIIRVFAVLENNSDFYLITAFQTVPSPNVTAKKLMTNLLGYSSKRKRSTISEDVLIVMDGSGSVGRCEFMKAKIAMKNMMQTARNPSYDTKYAAVTFGSSATVNFNFLPYSSAANEIMKISYPGAGWTNTQAGLAEVKKLFDDPTSGILYTI